MLQNLLITYRNQESMYIADQACPVRAVGKIKGDYYLWDTGMRGHGDDDLWREGEGGYEEISATPSVATFKAKPYGSVAKYDLEEKESADAPLDLDRTHMLLADQRVKIFKERQVATLLHTAANWTASLTCTGGNEWNQAAPTVSVLNQIWTALHTIRRASGYDPNMMVFGAAAWQTASQVPDLYGLMPSAERTSGLNMTAMLKAISEYFGLSLGAVVGKATYNSASRGMTETPADIWGDNVWVGYVSPVPTPDQPTAAAQLSRYAEGAPQTIVEAWDDEDHRMRKIRVRECRDFKVVSPVMGYPFIDVTA